MSIKPILFSGSMVRALMDGHKTQTRRVLDAECDHPVAVVSRLYDDTPSQPRAIVARDENDQFYKWPRTYAEGDLLWVRESWSTHWANDDLKPSLIDPDIWSIKYNADGTVRPAKRDGSLATDNQFLKNRPSIFMPKWASRLTLRVTDVRIQRLQEISEDDALSEGVIESWEIVDIVGTPHGPREIDGYRYRVPEMHDDEGFECAGDAFADLWDRLNAKRGFGWDSNPWVAAYTFEVIHKNVNAVGEFE